MQRPPPPPTASVHGHDVLRIVLAAEAPLTREELATALDARFGPAARFHTCSAEGMTARELLALLEARGKLRQEAGRMTAAQDRICAHGQRHEE